MLRTIFQAQLDKTMALANELQDVTMGDELNKIIKLMEQDDLGTAQEQLKGSFLQSCIL